MDKIENNFNKEGSSYSDGDSWFKPGIEIFIQVSGWIAVPIVLALVAGKALDTYLGTRPWFFLGFSSLAFLISSFGIVRVVSKYMKKMENKEKNKKNQ